MGKEQKRTALTQKKEGFEESQEVAGSAGIRIYECST